MISLLLVATACGCAQNNESRKSTIDESKLYAPVDSTYSFIKYDANHIVIEGDSAAMKNFAKKWWHLLESGSGNIAVVQIGASHVQGGSFPHQIRRNLIMGACRAIGVNENPYASFPVGPRGIIFPYSAAQKCNNPFDYKVFRSYPLELIRNVYKEPEARLGLCGIAVTARDSIAEVGIMLNERDITFTTSEITILGESPDGVVPQLRLSVKNDNVELLEPDSIDLNGRRFVFHTSLQFDTMTIIMPCGQGQSFTLTGILLDNDKPGITFHSIGVNGASINDYAKKCPYLKKDLSLIKPDLVIFGIGINDASGTTFDSVAFQKRYLSLVDSIRAVNPECAFIFITNNDSYRAAGRKRISNDNGPLARDAFYRIARQCGGAVWDQFEIMGGLESIVKWNEQELASRDKVHFTRKGYQLLGDMLSNALFEMLINMRSLTKDTQSKADDKNRKVGGTQRNPDTPRTFKKVKTSTDESKDEIPVYISY